MTNVVLGLRCGQAFSRNNSGGFGSCDRHPLSAKRHPSPADFLERADHPAICRYLGRTSTERRHDRNRSAN